MIKYALDKDGLTTLVNKILALLGAKTDKLSTAVKGQVLVDDGNGNLSGSNVQIGGESLADNPNVTTLATELAVSKIVDSSIEAISDEEINALFD
jgi:hypothetical protein